MFHSFRKAVVTILESAGLAEHVVANLKSWITYGPYSAGTSLAVKREALASLSYPVV